MMKHVLAIFTLSVVISVTSQSYDDKPNPKWSRKPHKSLRTDDEVEVPIVSRTFTSRRRRRFFKHSIHQNHQNH